MLHLWRIVDRYVRIVRMQRGVILVICLSWVERFQRDHLRHNCTRKGFCLFKLGDVCLRNVSLFLTGVENHRAVLAAGIRPLPIDSGIG